MNNELFDNKIRQKDLLLTSKEAALFLRITVGDLYNLCSSGKLRYLKLGRRNRYRREDLEKLLQERGGFQ